VPGAFGDADNSVTKEPATIDERGGSHFLPSLLDAERSIPDFISCAVQLRRAGRSSEPGLGRHGERRAIERVTPDRASEPRAARVVERLLAAGRDSGRIREATLAREFGIDPAHLGRLMRRATGLGFREWSLGIRMRLAVRALAETDSPVKIVALESGFTSTAQFDRGFRRLFGMTPGEFRRFVCGRARRSA
jgi:AraC-like DNA-binding protein